MWKMMIVRMMMRIGIVDESDMKKRYGIERVLIEE